jgi:hypothetical protein
VDVSFACIVMDEDKIGIGISLLQISCCLLRHQVGWLDSFINCSIVPIAA